MPPPTPSRRDSQSPAAGDDDDTPPPPPLTAEQRTLRDAWLSEMWPTCPEAGSKPPTKRRRTAA